MTGKVAVVGCGYWGKNVLRAFCRVFGEEQVIACDIDPAILQQSRQNHPAVETVSATDELWRREDVVCVAVATPVVSHFRFASQALESGKHVFVEKPLTLDPAEADTLRRLAESRQRTLFVDHLLLFHPAVERIRSWVRDGVLGELQYHYTQRMNLGIVRTEENALWSLAPHDVALALDLFDAAPVRVVCHGGIFVQKAARIEDSAFLAMEFPGGGVSHIHVSWLHPEKVRKVTLVGSARMAVFDDMLEQGKLRLYNQSVTLPKGGRPNIVREGSEEVRIPSTEPLEAAVRSFRDAVTSSGPHRSDGNLASTVVRVLAAAQDSLLGNGAPVEF